MVDPRGAQGAGVPPKKLQIFFGLRVYGERKIFMEFSKEKGTMVGRNHENPEIMAVAWERSCSFQAGKKVLLPNQNPRSTSVYSTDSVQQTVQYITHKATASTTTS